MRKSLSVFWVALALSALPACGERIPRDAGAKVEQAHAENAATGQPKAVAVEPDFNFGEVEEGVNVEHVFKLRNEGTAALAILSAKGS